MPNALLRLTENGLYCPAGDLYVDPWRPVPRAVITHAHADHATRGSGSYLTTPEGLAILQARMGPEARIETLGYGQTRVTDGVRVSLIPAGHIRGSAQVRLEHRGYVGVVSGDYKTEPDPTCAAFEPVRCDLFVTESTFGLPIYRWPDQASVFASINAWWAGNRDAGRTSILYTYSLGKAQRLLAGVNAEIGPILTHGAVEGMNRACVASGLELPATRYASEVPRGQWPGSLVLAPPSAQGTPWVRKFGGASMAFASGWMRVRGTRRRRALDRGFVLSDHADWPGLLSAIAATEATEVWVTHGYGEVLARWLRETGVDARSISTRFEGEAGSEGPTEESAGEPDAGSSSESSDVEGE